jgi:hypothetical protein
MMRRISSITFGTLLGALSLVTSPAWADAPKAGPAKATPPKPAKVEEAPKVEADPNKAQAAQRFDRGLQLFNEGDNAGALAEFKQAYALMPNPIVLYNIGLVYAAMGRPVDAVDALAPVVDSATLSPEQRERAQKALSDQQARIGRISVHTVPDGARIDVDGVEVARTPLAAPLRVAEGNHVIGAVAEGYAHARKEILVAGNADASVAFELVLSQAKRPANLSIRSRVRDAEVLVDDQAVGKTPLATSLAVPAGVHSVEVRRPGYQTKKQQVELGEAATGEVSLDLEVDPQTLATEGADFVLDVPEPSPDLTIDEVHRGLYTQPLRLPKGVHHVRVEVGGFLPFERDVTLESGAPNVFKPQLAPTPDALAAHNTNLRLHRTLGWILVGSGALVAGGSTAFLLANHSSHTAAQNEFDAAVADREAHRNVCNTSTQEGDANQCNANVDNAQARLHDENSKQTLGYVGIALGGAVIVGVVVVLLTGESSHRYEAASSSKARASKAGWALVPGPGQFGLGFGASF